MTCNGFEKYMCGEWSPQQFKLHTQTCQECRRAFEQDEKILGLSRSLKNEVEAPLLWSRIETTLQQETARTRASDNYRWIFRIAALLLLTVGILFLVRQNFITRDTNLLAASALKKVERQEIEYERSIQALEKAVEPQFSQLDQELMLLYRDRLETIDAQIEQCKEALATNPANAHIRQYLLAALRDKKQTLTEIIRLERS